METEESKELTLAQEETIKKTLEEIRKQDPKKNKRVRLRYHVLFQEREESVRLQETEYGHL